MDLTDSVFVREVVYTTGKLPSMLPFNVGGG